MRLYAVNNPTTMCSATSTFRFDTWHNPPADSAGTKYMHRNTSQITILNLDDAFFNKWFPGSTNRRDNMITVWNSIWNSAFSNTPLTATNITCTTVNWGGGNPMIIQPYLQSPKRRAGRAVKHGECWWWYTNSGYLPKYKMACSPSDPSLYPRFEKGTNDFTPVYLNDFGQMRTPVYYPKRQQ